MKIHFLGTCSGTEPMPDMHHCSLAFDINGVYYWFDAGEGCSHTAMTKMGIDLSRIRSIFISHPHIDHVGGQDEQIKYLGQIIDANMQSGAPTFVTGDFNLTPDQEAFASMVAQGYIPSYELAKKGDSKKVGTFGSSAVIDYLFVRNGTNVDTYLYKVCNETDYGKHSDHYPVFNILKF